MSDDKSENRIKVGILGFGSLGKHLYQALTSEAHLVDRYEVIYIWNRSSSALEELPEALRCENLDDVLAKNANIVVEVSHPSITARLAPTLLKLGQDFFVGSPTGMADFSVEESIRNATAEKNAGALYIPCGALWGAADIQALANRGSLHSLTLTMKKHPASFRLADEEVDAIRAKAEEAEGEHILYEGPVRGLCKIAPNNVNTMACAAMAAHTLGFDGAVGRLVADNTLITHEVEILALGKPNPTTGAQLKIHVVRSSPAPPGVVTSKATYGSFLESLIKARDRGSGIHFV